MFRAALSFAILSPAGANPVEIVEGFLAEALPAFKSGDKAKLDDLYDSKCVFGSTAHGGAGEQKDVLMVGIESAGYAPADKDYRDSIVGMKVMAANQITDDPSITAWVKVEMGKCTEKGKESECKVESSFYQWMVLQPKVEPSRTAYFGMAQKGWVCTSILVSPDPGKATTADELLELPETGAPSASPLPGSALVATFASGVLLSGLVFARKEISAKLMAPRGLQEPLL